MKFHKIEGDKDNRHKVSKALLDMFELVTNEMMDDSRYRSLRTGCPLLPYYATNFNFVHLIYTEHWIRPTFPNKMSVALFILEMMINCFPVRKLIVNPFHFPMKVVSIFPCQKVL